MRTCGLPTSGVYGPTQQSNAVKRAKSYVLEPDSHYILVLSRFFEIVAGRSFEEIESTGVHKVSAFPDVESLLVAKLPHFITMAPNLFVCRFSFKSPDTSLNLEFLLFWALRSRADTFDGMSPLCSPRYESSTSVKELQQREMVNESNMITSIPYNHSVMHMGRGNKPRHANSSGRNLH